MGLAASRTPGLESDPGAAADVACGGVIVGGHPLQDPAPEVSLVVSTIGRPEALRRLIASVQVEAVDGPTIELIVVDQSADGVCLAVLQAFEADRPPFSWTYTRSEVGVSRGRNTGLGLATGRLIMFPDDDAWFPGDTLTRSVAHFDRYPHHAGLCTQLKDGHGNPSMLRWADSARSVTKRNHHRTSIGSTMLFRADSARAAVGFDETIGPGADGWFGSCEDADFLLRVVETGATVWYEPAVVMHHRDSRRDGGPDAEHKALAYGCGQGHMWRQHRFPPSLIIALLLRRLFGGLLWNVRGRGDIGRAHRAWVRGAVNGWLDLRPVDMVAQAELAPSVSTLEGRVLKAPSGSEFGRSFTLRVAAAPVGTIATFALTAIVARTLPPGDVTIFYGVLAALMIGPILGRFGLNQRAIGELGAARTRDDPEVAAGLARRHVTSTLIAPLLASPAISLVFIVGVSRDRVDLTFGVMATVILAAEATRLTLSDVLTGLGLTGWATFLAHQFRAVVVTVAVAIDLLVFPGSLDLHRLMAIMTAVVVALAMVGFHRLWSLPHRPVQQVERLTLRQLLPLGLPFLVVDLVVVVVARGDVWLAAAALPERSAALYSTASVLAVQIGIPIGLANVALAPIVAGFVAQGRLHSLERMVRTLATVVAYFVLPILMGFVLFGDDLLGLAYGEQYRAAHRYLVILMLGNVTLAVLGASSVLLLMANRQWVAMSVAAGWFLIAAPVAVALTFIGGPLGLAAASAGTTVGLYLLLAAAAWLTTGIQLAPYLDPRRLMIPERLGNLGRFRGRGRRPALADGSPK